MSDRPLRLAVIIASTRTGRFGETVARWFVTRAQQHDDLQLDVIDLYGLQLPDNLDDSPQTKAFTARIDAADAFVIVTPEYNHGYPGTLKSVLDLLLREYVHKAVALVGVSAGPWGGTRVVESLVPVVRELGLAVCFSDLNFPLVKSKFDEEGNLLDAAYDTRAVDFLDELVWMARTLRWGRENVPSKFHPK